MFQQGVCASACEESVTASEHSGEHEPHRTDSPDERMEDAMAEGLLEKALVFDMLEEAADR